MELSATNAHTEIKTNFDEDYTIWIIPIQYVLMALECDGEYIICKLQRMKRIALVDQLSFYVTNIYCVVCNAIDLNSD